MSHAYHLNAARLRARKWEGFLNDTRDVILESGRIDLSLHSPDTLYMSVNSLQSPDAPGQSVAQSIGFMHIGVRLAHRQIPVCLSQFQVSSNRRPYTRTFDVCLLIAIARVDPKAKREPALVCVRLKAATGRYRNVSGLGLKANQGESQRTLIPDESSRSRSNYKPLDMYLLHDLVVDLPLKSY